MEAKKIIITGGATRIGAAIARSIASFDTKITIHYNTSKKDAGKIKSELENLGSEVFLVKANLENQKQTESLFKQAYQKMKGVDCLINNASVFENDNLLNFSEKSFAKHLNINLRAPSILSKSFKKYIKQNEGCIINIIDQRVEKLTPFFFSYTLSKVSLATLTKISAMKLAPNIRVNAVAPGPILWPDDKNEFSKTYREKVIKETLLKKVGNPTDISEAIFYLLTSASYTTGHILEVDGGRSFSL